MFEIALAPARKHTSAKILRDLRDVLVVMTGIDSLIALRDVAGLPPARGRRIMEWALRRVDHRHVRASRDTAPGPTT